MTISTDARRCAALPAFSLTFTIKSVALFRSIGTTLEMIKWEHSVLTLPFGLTGAVLAAGGIPSLHTSIWIIVALVAARSAAMAFNRLADATIDAANPRTKYARCPPAS